MEHFKGIKGKVLREAIAADVKGVIVAHASESESLREARLAADV